MPSPPRSFFLVIGKPGIRYTGPPSRAPLLFDVEVDEPECDTNVDHAETVEMPVAVPSQQPFCLTQPAPLGWRSGALLSFGLAMAKPGLLLRVLAGVDVKYCEGQGLHLVQAERSQNPFCVFEFDEPSKFADFVQTVEALQVRRLKPAQFSTDVVTGACRLTYAPIAIVLMYETSADASLSPSADSRASRASSPPAQSCEAPRGSSIPIVQYTFLDIPNAVFERAKLHTLVPEALDAPAGGAARPVFHAKVVRQMLQRGGEVYELDNVFDTGAWAEQSSDEERDDENGTGFCVICLANQKDTTLLPCRHMCLCFECAALLRFQQKNRCPICRSTIEQVLTV